MGEIDIVARRGDTLAIVEVKARGDWDTANEAVNARQRGRLARAAHAYLGANPHYAGYVLRFDVMLVTALVLARATSRTRGGPDAKAEEEEGRRP
nr:YraN family protein [Azospirillum brasilense]